MKKLIIVTDKFPVKSGIYSVEECKYNFEELMQQFDNVAYADFLYTNSGLMSNIIERLGGKFSEISYACDHSTLNTDVKIPVRWYTKYAIITQKNAIGELNENKTLLFYQIGKLFIVKYKPINVKEMPYYIGG